MKKKGFLKKVNFVSLGLMVSVPTTLMGTANYAVFSSTNTSLKAASNTISNYSDSLSSITNYDTYDPIYTDVRTPAVSTPDGTIGLSKDKKTIILTGYNGSIIWANDLSKDQALLNWYKENWPNVTVTDEFCIRTFAKVDEKNSLVALFGGERKGRIALEIDLSTGQLPRNSINSLSIFKSFDEPSNYGIYTNTIYRQSDITVNTITTFPFALFNTNSGYVSENLNNYQSIFVYSSGGVGGFDMENKPVNFAKNPSTDIFLGYVSSIKNSSEGFAVFYDSVGASTGNKNIYLAVVDNVFTTKKDKQGNYLYYDLTWKTEDLTPDYIANNFVKHFQILGDTSNWEDESNKTVRFVMPWQSYSWHDQNAENNNSGWKKGVRLFKIYNDANDDKKRVAEWWTRDKFDNQWIGDLTSLSVSGDNIFYTSKTEVNNESKNYAGIINIENNQSATIHGVSLLDSTENWDNSKVNLVPVYGESENNKIAYSLIHPDNNKQKLTLNYGDWDKVSSTANRQSTTLEFSARNDIKNILLNTSEFNGKLASDITETELNSYLKFREADNSSYTNSTPMNSQVTTAITNVNENEGSLDYTYTISYNPAFDTTKTLSYSITGTLNTFYKLNDLHFAFVTSENVDTNKWNEITNLKASKFANEVTKKEIIDHFISYTIKDISGNALVIDDSMVEINSATNESLQVTINLPTSRLPQSVTTTYTETFNGFNKANGFTKTIEDQVIDSFKSTKYATEITKDNILDEFVTLGDSYNIYSKDDYSLEINNADIYTGTLSFKLKLNATLPTGISSDKAYIFGDANTWYEITGFKTIYESFDNVNLSIETYSGFESPTTIWQDYLTNGTNSVLFTWLNNSKNINNWDNLLHTNDVINKIDISIKNQATADTDGYLDLGISLKENTQTNVVINGSNFVFDSTAKTNFANHYGTTYPFNTKLYVNYYPLVCEWNDTTSSAVTNSDDENITIDLSIGSYGNLNKDMKVESVTEADILGLINYKNYDESIKMVLDSSKGSLKATVTLRPKMISKIDYPTITKNISISGFYVEQMIKPVEPGGSTNTTNKQNSFSWVPIISGSIAGVLLLSFVVLVIVKKRKIKDLTD